MADKPRANQTTPHAARAGRGYLIAFPVWAAAATGTWATQVAWAQSDGTPISTQNCTILPTANLAAGDQLLLAVTPAAPALTAQMSLLYGPTGTGSANTVRCSAPELADAADIARQKRLY